MICQKFAPRLCKGRPGLPGSSWSRSTRTSSAQLADLYGTDELVGRQVAAVVNFPPRQIAKVVSEVLVLGFPDAEGRVVLVAVERPVPNGGRLY